MPKQENTSKKYTVADCPELSPWVSEKFNDEVTLKVKNYSQSTKVTFFCKDCNHTFTKTPWSFLKTLRNERTLIKCSRCRAYSKSLSKWHPELVQFWDFEANDLSPDEVPITDTRKYVTWICSKNPNHRFSQTVGLRINSEVEQCETCLSLGGMYPELLKEWDYERNTLDPFKVPAGSDEKPHWVCSNDKRHKWFGRIANRTNKNRKGGCPLCSGYIVDHTNNLEAMRPDIAKTWDHRKNGKLKPKDVFYRSKTRVFWKCPEGPDHEWEGTVLDRVESKGCLFCINQRVSVTNSLRTRFPEIAQEWHPTKNGKASPEKTLAISGSSAWWQCRFDPSHYWEAVVAQRTSSGNGCPHCKLAPRSKIELRVTAELKHFFNEIDMYLPTLIIDGKNLMPDIMIESKKLVIEYDGEYYHRDKLERDRAKNIKLNNAGWYVLRLREIPLGELAPSIPFDRHNFKESMNLLAEKLADLKFISDVDAAAYSANSKPINDTLYEAWLEEALQNDLFFKNPAAVGKKAKEG